jgi:hypothetical protein
MFYNENQQFVLKPNICSPMVCPEYPPIAPIKPQNTPYVIPQPCYTPVCSLVTGTCELQGPSTQNSQLQNFPSGSFRSSFSPFLNPLPQIYSRGVYGPWQKVGYVVSSNEPVKDRTMQLYARIIDRRRDRYDYRVTDTNGVAIDIDSGVKWKSSGDIVKVDGRIDPYTIKLYREFA